MAKDKDKGKGKGDKDNVVPIEQKKGWNFMGSKRKITPEEADKAADEISKRRHHLIKRYNTAKRSGSKKATEKLADQISDETRKIQRLEEIRKMYPPNNKD